MDKLAVDRFIRKFGIAVAQGNALYSEELVYRKNQDLLIGKS